MNHWNVRVSRSSSVRSIVIYGPFALYRTMNLTLTVTDQQDSNRR
uniref:Uncharacterized protein n=1 Tax=Arundo donax TaxID=35708 RepID=A0A0A8ZX18_ARUDO